MLSRSLRLIAVAVLLRLASQSALAAVSQYDDFYIQLWSMRPVGVVEGPLWVRIYDDFGRPGVHISDHVGQTPLVDELVFCVETHEYYDTTNPAYCWFDLTDAPGIQTHSSDRTLTGYSAWVYSQFQLLGLSPYSDGRQLDASKLNAFQEAIWAGVVKDSDGDGKLADEIGLAGSEFAYRYGATKSWTDTQTTLHDLAGVSFDDFLHSHWAGLDPFDATGNPLPGGQYDAVVEQMLASAGSCLVTPIAGQDQIFYYDSGGEPPVPEPASLAIWLLIGAMGVFGRAKLRADN